MSDYATGEAHTHGVDLVEFWREVASLQEETTYVADTAHWCTWINELIVWLRTAYKECGWNAFTTVSLFPPGSSTVLIGDGEVIRDIVNDRIKFPKSLKRYKVLQVFGLVSGILFISPSYSDQSI